MTTYAQWPNPVQHPYLLDSTRPSLKRKHSYYTSASSDVDATASSPTDYSPNSDTSDLPTFPDSANTTIDASQSRPRSKRRRYQSAGMEGEFNDLALEQQLNNLRSARETTEERMDRFWEQDGELEVDMLPDSEEVPSPTSVLHPSSFHSPEELGSNPIFLPSDSVWPDKDRKFLFFPPAPALGAQVQDLG